MTGGHISEDDLSDEGKFFDDEDELPRTAQDFQDWTETTITTSSNNIEEDVDEEESTPSVKGQEFDWDSWFKGESL